MARTFRTRRSMHAVAELNVTNLIDVAFTLLIIFMIATPLINNQEQTIPLNLPVESQSEQAKPDPDTKFVSVSVTMAPGGGGGRSITSATLLYPLKHYRDGWPNWPGSASNPSCACAPMAKSTTSKSSAFWMN